jgi:hypothetical protein
VVSIDGDDISILQTNDEAFTPMPYTASFAASKPRNCKIGISCGGTCIAKTKTCRKQASAGQKAKAQQIISSALVYVPKKVEPKSDPPAKAKSGKSSPSSDKIKKNLIREENISAADAKSDPRRRSLIEKNKRHNDLVRGMGDVGDPAKMSANDLMTALTKMDGEDRMDLLGVSMKHYKKKEVAKAWYREISKKVHPDVNKSEGAAKAFEEAESIYKNMIGR